jgi:hypothetical protein
MSAPQPSRSQYHLREQVGRGLNADIELLTHSLTRVVLTSLRRPLVEVCDL